MNLVSLPPALYAVALAVAPVVAGLLGSVASLVGQIPGFRASDATRTTALRALVTVLNLAGVVLVAWSQNLVISKEMLPALLVTVVGGAIGSHLTYVGVKNATAPVTSAPVTAAAPVVPAVATTSTTSNVAAETATVAVSQV